MKNMDIRVELTKTGVRQWEVAQRLNIAEVTLSRWMRNELSKEKKTAILNAIRQLADKRETP